MTITKEGARIVMTCNGCGAVRRDQDGQPAKFRPYKVVWSEAQAEGWVAKATADGKDWNHFCKGCGT